MNYDLVKAGIEIGDNFDKYEDFIPFLENYYDLNKLGFVLFFLSPRPIPEGLVSDWARFFKKNEIYFAFLYSMQRGAPAGKKSHFTPEMMKEIKDIAGEYFVGDMIGETGGLASWHKSYFTPSVTKDPLPANFKTIYEAQDHYVNYVKEVVDYDRYLGAPAVLAVEASALHRYNFQAGVDYTFLEVMCSNPEILFASARGASRAYKRDKLGAHIAHEWYGGFRNDDPLKYKRLKLAYDYSYISGANFIYPESGDISLTSYGYNYDKDSEYCAEFRRIWSEFADFVKNDKRPAGGPKVSVGFISGNGDAHNGGMGDFASTTFWNNFHNPDWAYGEAEQSYRIIDDTYKARPWHNVRVFGEQDFSNAPPYGLVDIVPIEAPLDVLSKYEYLIFMGYNAMTEEYYNKLKDYVAGGGKLFITAAHLNTNTGRDKTFTPIEGGNLSDFLGCDVTSEIITENMGYKFNHSNLMPNVLLPGVKGVSKCYSGDQPDKGEIADPILASCPARFAKVKLNGGTLCGVMSDHFTSQWNNPPVMIDNQYGKGYVSFLTTVDYPGAMGVYTLYSAIVKEIITAAHRNNPIRVLASDKIKFAVYENDETYVVYLINTDYDNDMSATVIRGDKNQKIQLAPLAIKRVEI